MFQLRPPICRSSKHFTQRNHPVSCGYSVQGSLWDPNINKFNLAVGVFCRCIRYLVHSNVAKALEKAEESYNDAAQARGGQELDWPMRCHCDVLVGWACRCLGGYVIKRY